MTINHAYYRSEIDEFASEKGYALATTHTLGHLSPGYSLLTLTHKNEEFMYSYLLVGIIDNKELYRLIYKNVITYEL